MQTSALVLANPLQNREDAMKTSPFAFLICTLITSCAPSPSVISKAVVQTLAALPTSTPAVTIVFETQIVTSVALVEQTVEVPVTVTPSPTPLFTPTVTLTASRTPIPSNTPRPTATEDPTRTTKYDGYYLVGPEISSGLWRSTGQGDSCYWELTTRTGDIIDNHFGMSGGTMYIPATAFQARLQDCGPWEFLSP